MHCDDIFLVVSIFVTYHGLSILAQGGYFQTCSTYLDVNVQMLQESTTSAGFPILYLFGGISAWKSQKDTKASFVWDLVLGMVGICYTSVFQGYYSVIV
jgi:hypothetical protein